MNGKTWQTCANDSLSLIQKAPLSQYKAIKDLKHHQSGSSTDISFHKMIPGLIKLKKPPRLKLNGKNWNTEDTPLPTFHPPQKDQHTTTWLNRWRRRQWWELSQNYSSAERGFACVTCQRIQTRPCPQLTFKYILTLALIMVT